MQYHMFDPLPISDSKSEDGVAGIQLSRYQAEWLCELLDDPAKFLAMVRPFYLRRKNIVAQAISLYRSASSGYFHSYQSEIARERSEAVPYAPDHILKRIASIVENEIWFEKLFSVHDIVPIRFFYEDLIESMPLVLRQ